MANMFGANPPKKLVSTYNDNILESFRSLGGGVGKSLAQDVARGVATDAIQSIVGSIPKSGDLKANEPIILSKDNKAKQESQPVMRRPEIVLRPPVIRREEANLKEQIEAVRSELKTLSGALKKLHTEVEKAVNEVPTHPGVYHINFMARLKSILLALREQVEDSNAWLALSTNRKKQKNYWGMYKKQGTKFGLSSERTLATQSG